MGIRLLLVRHGESLLGSEGRYAGHLDTPLTDRGRAQVGRLRGRYRALGASRVYTSDLVRCRETARILDPRRRATASPAIRELDFGAWEGRTYEENLRRFPKRFRRWIANPWEASAPAGETMAALERRVRGFVRGLVGRHPAGTVALVTHGGPIRLLLNPDRRAFWSGIVPPASLHVLEIP